MSQPTTRQPTPRPSTRQASHIALIANGPYSDRTPKVDVKDPVYAANGAIPDKLALWADHPVEEDGWVLAHNAVRHELAEFQKVLNILAFGGEATKLVDWQVHAVKEYIKGHLVHVHEHHSNEDNVFNPAVRTRVVYPDKLEADHVAIVDQMNAIERFANELAVGDTLAPLVGLWSEYIALMLPHLHEEETVGLPLVRAFFTPEEVGAIVQSFMKKGDPTSMGSFVHVMGSKEAAQSFMKAHAIPSFVWHVPVKGFKALRTLYRKRMQSHVDSLVQGKVVSSVHKPTAAAKAPTAAAKSPAGDENAVEQSMSPTRLAHRAALQRLQPRDEANYLKTEFGLKSKSEFSSRSLSTAVHMGLGKW